jgi:hypothetical protein
MPLDSYKTCTAQGCKNVIHADCLEDKDIDTWTCRSCTLATVQSTHADNSDDAAESTPGANGTSATTVKSEAVRLTTEDEDVVGSAVSFGTLEEAKQELRLRGFSVKETQEKYVRYFCKSCNADNFRLRLKAAEGGCWMCRPSEHRDGCPNKLLESEGVKIIRFKHEFGLVPGLQDFVECLGATGEMRIDQLFRSVKAKYGVHVDHQLLYRTARAAHDDMFGETLSDVTELLQLGEQIKSEGGTFHLVQGSSCCYLLFQCMLCLVHTVYTASRSTFITPCTLHHVAHSSHRVHCLA